MRFISGKNISQSGGVDRSFLYLLVLDPFVVRVCGGASPFRFVTVESA